MRNFKKLINLLKDMVAESLTTCDSSEISNYSCLPSEGIITYIIT